MDAVIKPSPVPSSPTTKSPFRGMPDRSSGFKNRTPSKLGADGEAVNGGRNGFTAVEFRSEWEDELERRAQRRRESESLREEGESPLGRKNSPSPPIPPPRAPRNESESAPSSAGPVPPPRRQLSNEQQRQREAAAALEAAVQRAAEVGAADYAALEEAEGLGKSPTTKSPTPPPRLIRSAGSSGGSEKVIREKGTPSSSPRQEGEPDPSAGRSFAGTKWVAKPGGPQRRPLHPLRPPPPPEEEDEEEPPPPDPLATAMNSSKVVGNFMLSAVEGAKTLAKEVVPLSPKGKYAGDGGAERDNIFRQKARFEASVRKEAEAKLQAVMPSFLQRTTDAEGASKLKAQIEAAKAAGVAGPVLAAAEQKLKAFAVGEENRQRAQSERLRKETEKAELNSPAGIARRAAEDQLRAVYPFPGMYADPAKLKPAIEAAKEAGVAAPIVAMAEAKLKEAEESPGRLVEAREKASSALESTAKTLQNFQDSVANWEMPNWDEGVTVTVGDTKVRGRGLSLLAMPVAVMGLVVKNRSQSALEEADTSLRRSRIVRAWNAERSAWVSSDTASVTSSDDGEKPPPSNSPFLLCVRGGKHLDTARASAEEQATAAGRSASFPPPPPTHSPTPPHRPRPTLPPHPPRPHPPRPTS